MVVQMGSQLNHYNYVNGNTHHGCAGRVDRQLTADKVAAAVLTVVTAMVGGAFRRARDLCCGDQSSGRDGSEGQRQCLQWY